MRSTQRNFKKIPLLDPVKLNAVTFKVFSYCEIEQSKRLTDQS